VANQQHSCRRTLAGRPARSGFTLLEVAFTLAILVVAIASTGATSISLSAFRRGNRERSVAHNAAAALAERIHSVARTAKDQPGAWGVNVVDAICPGGTLGTSFDVPELQPQDGLAHVGSVIFVADESRRDSALGVELGMPRDLDGDGAADKTDALPTATVLPVIIEMRWKGIRGNQRIVHPFFVASY
jgi:prepilin-type N-terminal cleavage/methylation domain-containing protein